MVLRDLCILYEVCLLKVCYFYFLFFRKTFLSLTKWMVSKGGGHVLEQHLGWQMAVYSLAACLFSPLCFCFLKILCDDKSRGYNIMHCKTS